MDIIKTSKGYCAKSCAKVNLFLHLTSRQSNGYHNLYSLFVPVSIYDSVTVTKSTETALFCDDSDIPTDDRNTIMKVDKLLRNKYGLIDNYNIYLEKVIPSGAGLGGGSSNAATYMKMINKISRLGLSNEDMVDIMSAVGSDTIFFIDSCSAIVTGRGEVVNKYNGLDKIYLLIVYPNIHISTSDVYNSGKVDFSDIDNIKALHDKITYDDMSEYVYNGLETAVFSMSDDLRRLKNAINGYLGGIALVSGSGSSVFAVYKNRESRDEAYCHFTEKFNGYKLFCANSI